MRRRLHAATVVVVALLAAMHAPAVVGQTGDTLVVGSQHTDFGAGNEANPQTLENLTREGSGDAATVTLETETGVRDSFEDQDFAGWTESPSDAWTITSTAADGSYAAETTQDGTWQRLLNDQPYETGATVSGWLRGPADSEAQYPSLLLNWDQSTESGYVLQLNPDYDQVFINKWADGSESSTLVDEGPSLPAGEFIWAEFRHDSNGTLVAELYDGKPSDGGSLIWSHTVTDTDYSGGSWGVGSFRAPAQFDDVGISSGGTPDSATYVSDPHAVSNAEEAAINITQLSNVSVDAQVRTDGGTTLGSSTITSTGNHTVALSDSSSESLETVLDVTVTGENPKFELADESILFNNSAPTVDNASASPTGALDQQTIDLSINVSDPQFGTAQGEELDVRFVVDNETVGTDTLTSNGTASVQHEVTTGGSKSWFVVVNDSYGDSVTSDTFQFTAPSTIEFREEGNPDQLVDNATVQVTAYYSGEVEKRTVNDGTLDLTDFPIDEPIIVRANASGSYTRTVVIESIYDQSTVFLLNDSKPTYTVQFQLQDLTGEYPESETILLVERDLTINGSTEWRTLVGDNFGVSGVTARLLQNERYRLRIKNLETGETDVIGAYTPVQSETVTVSTGSASLEIPDSEKNYGWALNKDEENQQIVFEYDDSEQLTREVKLTIHERFNKSNVLVNNVTFSDANDITYQHQLTANETNTTWMAEIYVDRGDGVMHFREPVAGGQQTIIPSDLDQVWLSAVGVFVVLVSALAFSALNRGVGAVATALTGGTLWWFGFLETVAIGPAVVAAIVLAVTYHYYSATPGGGA